MTQTKLKSITKMGNVTHTTHGEALDSNNYNQKKKSSELRGGKNKFSGMVSVTHTTHGGGGLWMKINTTVTVSNENTTSPKSTKSKNSDSPLHRGAHIQIKILFSFEFVPRHSNIAMWWVSGVWHFQWNLNL